VRREAIDALTDYLTSLPKPDPSLCDPTN